MGWSLSQAAFNELAQDLVRRGRADACTDRTGHWTWRRVEENDVGPRQDGMLIVSGLEWTLDDEDDLEEEGEEEDPAALRTEDLDEDEDPAALKIDRRRRRPIVTAECHVVWSVIYNVPVLYFAAHRADGMALSLHEVLRAIEVMSGGQRLETSGLFPSVLLEEHPHLQRPFFCLHPCNTSEVMGELLLASGNGAPPANELLSWLSLAAPLVGIHLPLSLLSSSK